MNKHFTIRALHATTQDIATTILQEGFKNSQNSYDWLGSGIYFFQEAPNFAYHWATQDRKEGQLDDVALIAADIDVTGFIDLLDYEWGGTLKDTYRSLDEQGDPDFRKVQERQQEFVLGSDKRQGHWLDRYVLEASVTMLEANDIYITGIRSAFWEGSRLYPKSHLMDRQHIQIAVREVSAIKNLWREL